MDLEEIIEYTDLELRGQATEDQVAILGHYPDLWRSALCILKRKAETQMTSYKARVFGLHLSSQSKEITTQEYLERLHKERVWKTGANRFIQEVESKIMGLKNDTGNS